MWVFTIMAPEPKRRPIPVEETLASFFRSFPGAYVSCADPYEKERAQVREVLREAAEAGKPFRRPEMFFRSIDNMEKDTGPKPELTIPISPDLKIGARVCSMGIDVHAPANSPKDILEQVRLFLESLRLGPVDVGEIPDIGTRPRLI